MRRVWRGLLVFGLLVGLAPLTPLGVAAEDAEVRVCTDEAFTQALDAVQQSGGGTLTITCGAPIIFESQKTISTPVTIFGGGTAILDGGAESGQGGTRLFWVESTGTLELIGVTLQNGNAQNGNAGLGYGGAIYNAGGTVVATASVFDGNRADQAGAIFNRTGTLIVTASRFIDNSANDAGAIQSPEGSVTVTASTFSGNSALRNGGAIVNGVGIVSISATLEVTASTFSGNSAGGVGGAILNLGFSQTASNVSAVVRASTFSGNSATEQGGALYNQGSIATIVASTFSDNSGDEAGAAIRVNSSTVSLQSTILANGDGDDCSINSSTFTSLGYNLSDDDSCNLDPDKGDIPNSTNIDLGPLQDNGGPTRTMLPATGSDAADAIPPDACPTSTTATDQRGAPRPTGADAWCDIGAVEVEAVVPPVLGVGTPSGFEGQPLSIVVAVAGPAESDLIVGFDCDANGSYETIGLIIPLTDVAASVAVAECTFPDDTTSLGVATCAGEVCQSGEIGVNVLNVAPTITGLTASGPVQQGQPVTITATAMDPAKAHDPLTYHFDCDADGDYETPGDDNQGTCLLDPGTARVEIGVLVMDDEGGEATGSIEVGQWLTLCADAYTGKLTAPLAKGGCPGGKQALALPGETSQTLCIHPLTGALNWAPRGNCAPTQMVHLVPESGALVYCEQTLTGALRYTPSGACSKTERAGVIPGL